MCFYHRKCDFSENKALNQRSAKLKYFFDKFCVKFLAFSSYFLGFCPKNVEKAYFDQH